MAVPTTLNDLSTTDGSNSPTGSEQVFPNLDDYLRGIQGALRRYVGKGSDIASASSITVAADYSFYDITGTTTITGIAATNAWTGRIVWLQFDSALTLTHNASTFVLTDGEDMAIVAGDIAGFQHEGSGTWRMINIMRSVVRGPGLKNAVMNGDWQIWQRATSFSSIATGVYFADRWTHVKVGAMVFDVSRNTASVPTAAQAGRFILYSMLATLITADNAIAATDIMRFTQPIEGYVWKNFAQRTVTLSFWVNATTTGIYCVSLTNGIDRSYAAEYTINTTNTWEKKTVTFVASPSAGTWDYTTGVGAYLSFVVAAGSNFHITGNAWQSSLGYATSNQVNGTATGSTSFRLAGIQLEAGSKATEFEGRTFDDELLACMRYYEKSFEYATAPAQNTGSVLGAHVTCQVLGASLSQNIGLVPFRVRKRVLPGSVTIYNPSAANAEIRNTTAASDWSSSSTSNKSENGFLLVGTTPAGSAAGQNAVIHWVADADL